MSPSKSQSKSSKLILLALLVTGMSFQVGCSLSDLDPAGTAIRDASEKIATTIKEKKAEKKAEKEAEEAKQEAKEASKTADQDDETDLPETQENEANDDSETIDILPVSNPGAPAARV